MKKQFQALLLIISILFSIIPQNVASADADLVQSQGTTVSKNETTQKTTFPVHVIHKAGDDKENFVIVIMGDGYALEEQDKFLQDAAEKAERDVDVVSLQRVFGPHQYLCGAGGFQ